MESQCSSEQWEPLKWFCEYVALTASRKFKKTISNTRNTWHDSLVESHEKTGLLGYILNYELVRIPHLFDKNALILVPVSHI